MIYAAYALLVYIVVLVTIAITKIVIIPNTTINKIAFSSFLLIILLLATAVNVLTLMTINTSKLILWLYTMCVLFPTSLALSIVVYTFNK